MIGIWELFLKGGPIMWPILLLSIVTGGVVLERLSVSPDSRSSLELGSRRKSFRRG